MRGLYTDERGISPVVATLLLLSIFIGIYAIYMTVTIPGEFASKEKEHMSEVRDSFLRLQRAVKNMPEQGAQSIHVPMSAELFSGSVRGPSVGGKLSTRASFIDYTTVGFWLMDEGSGDNVYDETRYQNHGVRYGATWVAGAEDIGNALSFDGVNDYVNCDNGASLDVTTGITLQAWIIIWTGSANDRRIVSKQQGDNGYLLAVTNGDKIKFWLGGGTGNTQTHQSKPINLNQWCHVAATWSTDDDNKMRIYINGQEDAAAVTFTGPVFSAPVQFRIGSGEGGEYFEGIIDSVIVYNRALSKEEIGAYYNGQASYYGGVGYEIKNAYYALQRYVYEDGAVILVQDNESLMVSMPSLLTIEARENQNVEVRLRTVHLSGSGETSGAGSGTITATAENVHSTLPTSTPNLENLTIAIYSEYRDAWKSYLLWLADNLSSGGIYVTVDFQNLQLTIYGKDSTPGVNDIYLIKGYREIDASIL